MKLNVIVGGKTELATSIVELLIYKREAIMLLARDKAEELYFKKKYGNSVFISMQIITSYDEYVIIVCAFSIIHPVKPSYPKDIQILRQDSDRLILQIEKINALKKCASLIFVSSVLEVFALKSSSYYSSMKSISKSILIESCLNNNVNFYAFHPGRLIKKRSVFSPLTYTNTTFGSLSRKILAARNLHNSQKFRIVGVDARIYIVIYSVKLAMIAIL